MALSRAEANRPKLQALNTDCGCVAGTVAMLLAMAAYAHYFLYAHVDQYTRKEKIIAGCAILVASGLLGKTFGILLARLRHKTLKRRLAKEVS
jgi:uncharacterized membrane protein YsdA (DUF1294 family)